MFGRILNKFLYLRLKKQVFEFKVAAFDAALSYFEYLKEEEKTVISEISLGFLFRLISK